MMKLLHGFGLNRYSCAHLFQGRFLNLVELQEARLLLGDSSLLALLDLLLLRRLHQLPERR